MDPVDQQYLRPTLIIDSDHREVRGFAQDTVGQKPGDPVARAVKLYYAVRDGIWYDPYTPFYRPEHYRASNVLRSGRGFCVCKASLLCALGRACGIPSRLGFADVRNHLASRQLIEMMGSNLFVYHGYTEFFLEGKWVVATPAFNTALCQKHRVPPLEFNGRDDSIFQPCNLDKKLFMEYVAYHGTCADVPVEAIVAAWKAAYGKVKVNAWIQAFERQGGMGKRDFYQEEVLEP